MLNGVWSEECARCKQEEEVGPNSRRLHEMQQWDLDFKEAQRVTKEDGRPTEDVPVYYDLRFVTYVIHSVECAVPQIALLGMNNGQRPQRARV